MAIRGVDFKWYDGFFLSMLATSVIIVAINWKRYDLCTYPLHIWIMVDYTTVFVFRLLMFVDNGLAAGMDGMNTAPPPRSRPSSSFSLSSHGTSGTTSVGSNALYTSPKGETTLFQSSIENLEYVIPKKILWDQVEFPSSWHFDNVVPAIEQQTEDLEQITQNPDGSGDLVFSTPLRRLSRPQTSEYTPSRAPSRASCSSIPIHKTRIEEILTPSEIKIPKLTRVKSHPNIAQPMYKDEDEESQDTQGNVSSL